MAIDNSIPKEIEDEVRNQLEPLFSEFYTGSKMYKTYYEYLEQLNERMGRAIGITQIVVDAYKSKTLEPKARTAFDVLLYLTQIELIGTAYVDVAILLLTAKGIDLHLEPDDEHRYTRHVTTPKDLDSPSLSLHVKLDFLKMNGIPFFEKCIDRALRNDIAHADFEIDENGKFFCLTRMGKKQEVKIREKFECYAYYMRSIGKVLKEQMEKVHRPQ